MAVCAVMQLSDIIGECRSAPYAGWIECLSFSFGGSTPIAQEGFGRSAGQATFRDFDITKYMDKASPKLFECCATGKHVPKATLVFRRSGEETGQLMEYFRYDFEDLIVSSYNSGGSGHDQGLPVESLSFNFAKVTGTYFIQEAGRRKGQVAAGYDIRRAVAS